MPWTERKKKELNEHGIKKVPLERPLRRGSGHNKKLACFAQASSRREEEGGLIKLGKYYGKKAKKKEAAPEEIAPPPFHSFFLLYSTF